MGVRGRDKSGPYYIVNVHLSLQLGRPQGERPGPDTCSLTMYYITCQRATNYLRATF